jgi:hypothetical protein
VGSRVFNGEGVAGGGLNEVGGVMMHLIQQGIDGIYPGLTVAGEGDMMIWVF